MSGPTTIDPGECVTEPANTLLNGPLHNQIPDPATIGRGTDNNTFWVPELLRDFYQQLIYSTNGVQQRIRKDLNGGISIRRRDGQELLPRGLPGPLRHWAAPPRRG